MSNESRYIQHGYYSKWIEIRNLKIEAKKNRRKWLDKNQIRQLNIYERDLRKKEQDYINDLTIKMYELGKQDLYVPSDLIEETIGQRITISLVEKEISEKQEKLLRDTAIKMQLEPFLKAYGSHYIMKLLKTR